MSTPSQPLHTSSESAGPQLTFMQALLFGIAMGPATF